jgi:glycosyltransferase involved in cell wall biosynthesis
MSGCPLFDVAIVGTVGVPARYGGFETLAEQLVVGLAARRRLLVFCSTRGRTARPATYKGATLDFIDLDANGWQSVPYDVVSLLRAAPRARTLLVLGVSGCLALPLVRLLFRRVRIVTNIDGVEWQRAKWGRVARAVLRASEWAAVRFSHAVIADNQGIVDHVQLLYRSDSQLIAYGGDHGLDDAPAEGARDTRFDPGRYALAVCRIEPENHIGEILDAFAADPAQQAVIVGNWNASTYGRELRARHGGRANVELLDPIYDVARLLRLRREARACLHGHSAGGTNPSLVEAMNHGMPVLAYDVLYNRHTTHGRAHYWRDSAGLSRLLRELDDATLAASGREMKAIAATEYTWQTVVARYEAALFTGETTS